jgi:hypothetical protein
VRRASTTRSPRALRFDLTIGRARAISIKANARSAGPISKKLRLGKLCN